MGDPDLGGTVALPWGLVTQHSQPLIPDLGAGTPPPAPVTGLAHLGRGQGTPSTIGMVGVQLQEPSGSTRQAMRAADARGDD